jgi:hypothetical protein
MVKLVSGKKKKGSKRRASAGADIGRVNHPTCPRSGQRTPSDVQNEAECVNFAAIVGPGRSSAIQPRLSTL